METRRNTMLENRTREQAFFPAQIRGQMKTINGREVYEVTGTASSFGRENRYRMHDGQGPYHEWVHPTALDDSLANHPDVALLLNHKGMSMARMKPDGTGTLQVRADYSGLHFQAQLNAKRNDVNDLALAMADHDIEECSFAFQLQDGYWNESMDEFCITRADINRGDVSIVNYGANPNTSVSFAVENRMAELDHMLSQYGIELSGNPTIDYYRQRLNSLDRQVKTTQVARATLSEYRARFEEIGGSTHEPTDIEAAQLRLDSPGCQEFDRYNVERWQRKLAELALDDAEMPAEPLSGRSRHFGER